LTHVRSRPRLDILELDWLEGCQRSSLARTSAIRWHCLKVEGRCTMHTCPASHRTRSHGPPQQPMTAATILGILPINSVLSQFENLARKSVASCTVWPFLRMPACLSSPTSRVSSLRAGRTDHVVFRSCVSQLKQACRPVDVPTPAQGGKTATNRIWSWSAILASAAG